ncbi:MAG: RimK family alpha-L-glutamate ligase [bacterium]
MIIHILVFSNSNKTEDSTTTNLDFFVASAKKLGHEIKFIYDYDCQLKFNGKPGLIVKDHALKNIKLVIVKANTSGKKLNFRSSFVGQLELMGITVINKETPIMCAKNKIRTLQILSKNHIPIPKTYVVRHAEDLDELVKDIGHFPVILKTVSGSKGAGVSIIESQRGLKSVVDLIVKENYSEPIILQEYIREAEGRDVRVFVVGNKVVGAMERIATKEGEFRSNFHLGGKVQITDLSAQEKSISLKATKACGLDFAGVDIIRSNNGPRILEVNANPGLEGITLATGKDIAGEIIKYAVSQFKKK